MSTTVTTERLRAMKRQGEKIACLTAYDATFAALLDANGVDVILVGDSLGMVLQGHDSTLPVSVDDMVYHAAGVARAARRALRVVDMPFMSYASTDQALANAARLMREGGAQMVKLEGGQPVVETVARLVEQGIPVCAHLGLTPQSVHQLGGYRVQGRDAVAANRMLEDARALDQAGASALVLECVPMRLAGEISAEVGMPTIGIGAGPRCDGQVLVLHDLLGVTAGGLPRFARDFLSGADSVAQAVQHYVEAVRAGNFPAGEHSFE